MKGKSYSLQWLDEEELWYLTIHEDGIGITFEGWYHNVDQALKDIKTLE
jgi:hypothetical protein